VTYNQDGSDFYKLATSLKRKFDTQYGKIVKLDASPETAAAAAASDVTLQDKRAMAKLLYQITKEDLGKTLVEIERKCSDAIQRNAREDQIELNIDCLSGELVRELTQTLQA
jgi:predicted flavoprotein YhiN